MMMKKRVSERGSAMLLVTVIVLVLSGISLAYASISWWNTRRAYQDEAGTKALYIAESVAAQMINDLNTTGGPLAPTAKAKTEWGGGEYWVATENLVNFGDSTVVGTRNLDSNYFAFQVAGKFNKTTRRINVLVTGHSGGVFWNAIYAGNNSNDPSYVLNLGGVRGNGDNVYGDVYSGGSVSAGDAANIYDVNGGTRGATVTYKDTYSNTMSGSTSPNAVKGTQPDLSIPRTHGRSGTMSEAEAKATETYASSPDRRDSNGIAWIDVSGEFNKSGVATSNNRWNDGSYATDILDVNNPAHIFRKDPSSTSGASNNRTSTYEYMAPSAKSDYYLEDPTNRNVTEASLTGRAVNGDTTASMINIKENGNKAVYFIDGNMRISGEPIKSYQLKPDPTMADPNLKMTIVVKGNVSMTDNLLYPAWESKKDAVAIIAIKDDNFPNTTAGDFRSGAGVLPAAFQAKNPGLSTVQDFVDDYNRRASQARRNNLIMPDIDISTEAGRELAAQAYNKSYGSGNVYFGDPGSGTVEHFESFMYAENNFYATNLDSTTASGGTRELEIFGNMTAGNQVKINRNTSSGSQIPLTVKLNSAIIDGNGPPGLPQTPSLPGEKWRILSWKQSSNTAETGFGAAMNEK